MSSQTFEHSSNCKNKTCKYEYDYKNIPEKLPQKSIFIAYVCWLFGGLFGLHHLYLHRDRHAFALWCTFGGYLGLGWVVDPFYIPEYVRDCNEDPKFIDKFKDKIKKHSKPNSKRFSAAVMLGYLFGQLFQYAIPEEIFGGVEWTFLHWGIPFFVALGVWNVGNIGREQGVLRHCLIAAYAIYPVKYILYDDTYTLLTTAIFSAITFDTFSKRWITRPLRRRGLMERGVKLTGAIAIYLSLWGCFFYFNGTIKDDDGGETPVYEAITKFFTSDWWTDFKNSLTSIWRYGQHHGWYEIWKKIRDSMDKDDEQKYYVVLGLSANASQTEITSAYRKLSKEFHPDKAKSEEDRVMKSEKFMEIQQAYDRLSKLKASRKRKNKKYKDDF